MIKQLHLRWIEAIVLFFSLSLATLRATIFWTPFWKTSPLLATGWRVSVAWVFVASLVFYILTKENFLELFKKRWTKETFLLVFLSFSFLSMFWSISFSDSFYRFSILLFSSFVGAYIGLRYGLKGTFSIFLWYAATTVILSFALRFTFPDLAFHYAGHPYYGAWRGVYWHRNILGAMDALFNAAFLLRILMNFRQQKKIIFFDMIFYLLTLILVFFAKSAAGYLIVILLHLLIILIFFWRVLRKKMKKVHYYLFALVAFISGWVTLANLDFVFGIFNRKPNLTGRVPMWEILIENVVLRSPWVGYGFGAIWANEKFRLGIKETADWAVFMADNGFLDILLYLGIIGLVLFLAFWGKLWVRSVIYAFKDGAWVAFFPLILLTFTLFGNISFSFWTEAESFVWMMVVAISFAIPDDKLN